MRFCYYSLSLEILGLLLLLQQLLALVPEMRFCTLAPVKNTLLHLRWMLSSDELVEDVGERCFHEKVCQEAEAERQRDESEEVKECVEYVSPDTLLQVKDTEFHEDAIAEEDTVSQPSVWSPIAMLADVNNRHSSFILEDHWHHHQRESNNVHWPRDCQVS